ncbi:MULTISPECIES: DUF2948 family protein [Limibacillus]|jgi:hypothetical protein|uniref:DUF2948 family protein n=1 Tax=Limibacillus halophilus TaxID=1579333 RepID=A0A839SXS9_9PROT|nr:DUF2948 family protein [Limibacillus halophilus]MBB3066889.1 hypothetical protein [Limibacillus halophilus]
MTEGDRNRGLKLRVRDAEDLAVASAMLQDALIPVQEMRFLAKEKRFALVANRFCWERAPESLAADAAEQDEYKDGSSEDVAFAAVGSGGEAVYERVNCGVIVHCVKLARLRGFDLADRGRILELLAITLHGKRVILTFAGGAAVELTVTRLSCQLDDLGEPWPTLRRPQHADSPPDDLEKSPSGNPDLES